MKRLAVYLLTMALLGLAVTFPAMAQDNRTPVRIPTATVHVGDLWEMDVPTTWDFPDPGSFEETTILDARPTTVYLTNNGMHVQVYDLQGVAFTEVTGEPFSQDAFYNYFQVYNPVNENGVVMGFRDNSSIADAQPAILGFYVQDDHILIIQASGDLSGRDEMIPVEYAGMGMTTTADSRRSMAEIGVLLSSVRTPGAEYGGAIYFELSTTLGYYTGMVDDTTEVVTATEVPAQVVEEPTPSAVAVSAESFYEQAMPADDVVAEQAMGLDNARQGVSDTGLLVSQLVGALRGTQEFATAFRDATDASGYYIETVEKGWTAANCDIYAYRIAGLIFVDAEEALNFINNEALNETYRTDPNVPTASIGGPCGSINLGRTVTLEAYGRFVILGQAMYDPAGGQQETADATLADMVTQVKSNLRRLGWVQGGATSTVLGGSSEVASDDPLDNIQQAPIIDAIAFTKESEDSALNVSVTWHDPDGDAEEIFYDAIQSYGGSFSSQSQRLTSSFSADGQRMGTSTIVFYCSSEDDAATLFEIYLKDELGSLGASHFARVTCKGLKVDGVEIDEKAALVPIAQQLGVPVEVTTNTAPVVLGITSSEQDFGTAVDAVIQYQDVEGDATQILFKAIDTDVIAPNFFPEDLTATYFDQNAGTAEYQYGFICNPDQLSFYLVLEVELTDSKGNTSEPSYMRLDCTAEKREWSQVSADEIEVVSLPPGAPVVKDVTFESTTNGGSQAITFSFHYGDAEGDIERADFKLIEDDQISFRDSSDYLAGDPFMQTRGNIPYSVTYPCSEQMAFSNTIQMVLIDVKGNQSAPIVYRLDCDVSGGKTAVGTLISAGDETQVVLQPNEAQPVDAATPTLPPIEPTAAPDEPTATIAAGEPTASATEVAAPVTTAVPTEAVQCPGVMESRLVVGERARVVPGGKTNRIRSDATTGAAELTRMPGGSEFEVLDGPVCADGYAWWEVDYFGTIGWTAEGDSEDYWLEPLDEEGIAPSTGDAAGCTMISDVVVNLRTGPGTNFDRAGQLPFGTEVGVVGKRTNSSGNVWYKLANGYWAREDVIDLRGDCSNVPTLG